MEKTYPYRLRQNNKFRFPGVLLSIFSIWLLAGCGNSYYDTTNSTSVDIYLAGSNVSQGVPTATLWKNGSPFALPAFGHGSNATAIAVSGSDIFIAGMADNGLSSLLGNLNVAEYWKNGIPLALTDGTTVAAANSIYVENGDVYVAGGEIFSSNGFSGQSVAEYWKNGTRAMLANPPVQDGSVEGSTAFSVCVHNGHVYVAGYTYQQIAVSKGSIVGGPVATIWVDGVPTSLSDALHTSVAYSVTVSGNDVYAAGYLVNGPSGSSSSPAYWKNGQPIVLATAAGGYATSIAIQKGNVLVSGIVSDGLAAYWTNGGMTLLGGNSASQIAYFDQEIYVSGGNASANYVNGPPVNPLATITGALYWVDGSPVGLLSTNTTSLANGIAIIPR